MISPEEKQAILQAVSDMITNSDCYRSCATCDFMEDDCCSLVGEKPPVDVIVNSCEQWVDQIPF